MKIDATPRHNAIYPAQAPRPMPRSMRLIRWAELLDRCGTSSLYALRKTDFHGRAARTIWRNERSPLSVAFSDPVLRAHGLAGETYADALAFFALRNGTLHAILCYHHYVSGPVLPAGEVAARVRRVARRAQQSEWLSHRLRLRGTATAALLDRLFA